MINNMNIIGRLTRDPELRRTPSGIVVSNFTIGSTIYASADKHTMYLDCVAFGRMAENIAKYCRKGYSIALDGNLDQEDYEDKMGNKRRKYRLIIREAQFLEPRKQDDGTEAPDGMRPNQEPTGYADQQVYVSDEAKAKTKDVVPDDLPF